MVEQKICMLSPYIPPSYAGAGRRALSQAKYLATHGFRIVFITVTKTNEQFPNLEMVTVHLPKFYEKKSVPGKICRLFYQPLLFIKMWKAVSDNNVNLLHCIPSLTWPTYFAAIAAKYKGAKIIVEPTLAGANDPLAVRNSVLGKMKFLIFNIADAIVNISPQMEYSCKEAGLADNKLYLIPNGIDIDKFSPPTEKEKHDLRNKFGLNHYRHVFIYVGIMRPRKGVSELIEAFKLAKMEVSNSCLILIGPADKDDESKEYYKILQEQVEKDGLKNNVLFIGEVENIEEWMKSSDIFLFASRREGLPNVLIEAAGTGLPVVAMKIPKVTDYIFDQNSESGIIVDDMDKFSKAIVKLVSDRDYYNKVSRNARERALSCFSNKVVMEKYEKLYKKLLSEDGSKKD